MLKVKKGGRGTLDRGRAGSRPMGAAGRQGDILAVPTGSTAGVRAVTGRQHMRRWPVSREET